MPGPPLDAQFLLPAQLSRLEPLAAVGGAQEAGAAGPDREIRQDGPRRLPPGPAPAQVTENLRWFDLFSAHPPQEEGRGPDEAEEAARGEQPPLLRAREAEHRLPLQGTVPPSET